MSASGNRARWIYLSHPLSAATPMYGGDGAMELIPLKQISLGDTANTTRLAMPTHIGSHVDAPRHFIAEGRTVDDYAASDWVFEHPMVVDASVGEATLIDAVRFAAAFPVSRADADLLLVRTGAEALRGHDAFWRSGPGLSADGAQWLVDRFPSLRALGLDSISLSSFAHRDEGRAAHRILLGRDIRLFEDLDLRNADSGRPFRRVIALPVRLAQGDGAPVTMIAERRED